MYKSISKLDRDVACAFLNASTIPMQNEPIVVNDSLSQSHPYAQLDYPKNGDIIPMYYDVIIETVTDYDIFYPIAKQTTKYYDDSIHQQPPLSNNCSTYPKYRVDRLDEFAVSIDFPHDYNLSSNWPNRYQYEHLNPTWIPYSRTISTPIDPYYFYPERVSKLENNEQPSARYITTPFFWFRPVLNHDYAICIPTTTSPTLHAFITPPINHLSTQSRTNSIRL